MTHTTDFTSNGFKSARQVWEGVKEDGAADHDVKGMDGHDGPSGRSSMSKRKRSSPPSNTRPFGRLSSLPSTEVIDLTRSDDDSSLSGFDLPPSGPSTLPRPPLVRLPRPVYASSRGRTSAASMLRDDHPPISTSGPSTVSGQSMPISPKVSVPNLPSDRHHAPVMTTDDYELSEQQARILAKILQGESYFFTGSAGTGKSVLLRAIIQAFKQKIVSAEARQVPTQRAGSRIVPWKLGITASTGVSAINIGGSTLHSWAGIGLAQEPMELLTVKVQGYQAAVDRWEQSSALIIDEISMIDGKLFTKLDHIGRTIRKNDSPFGGLQLILCGDFYQLPPVAKRGDPPALYAFDSPVWSNIFASHNMACLMKVFRQKDVEFVRMLNEMREGRVSRADTKTIQSLSRELVFPDSIPPVELYPTKIDVDQLNTSKLEALAFPSYTYEAADSPGRDLNGRLLSADQARKILNDQTLFVPQIELRVGAVVMLLTNYTDRGLCNGSIVVDFATFDEAMAMGVDRVGMWPSQYTVFPIVEFIPGKYVTVPTPKRVVVPCVDLKVENSNGTVRAVRIQLPLILAWGLTIHKSQGLSLDRVKVNLARTFANGQAYVALSRATSMEGLQVLNFDETKLKVSGEVLDWSRTAFIQEEADI